MSKTYLTLKDPETGDLLPRAGFWNNTEYGRPDAEATAAKTNTVVVVVEVKEVGGK